MAVIDSDGLIGKIVNIRDNTSDIKLITTNENLLLHTKPPDAKDHVLGTAKELMEVMSGDGQMEGK